MIQSLKRIVPLINLKSMNKAFFIGTGFIVSRIYAKHINIFLNYNYPTSIYLSTANVENSFSTLIIVLTLENNFKLIKRFKQTGSLIIALTHINSGDSLIDYVLKAPDTSFFLTYFFSLFFFKKGLLCL